MKKIFWLVGGLCAAAAGFLVWDAKRVQPVEELAHRLEDRSAKLRIFQPGAARGRDLAFGHDRLVLVVRQGREEGEPAVGALPFPDGVERLVDGDAIKPGAQLGMALEAPDIAMGLDEGFLDDVVGEGGIIQDALDAAPKPRIVISVQFTPGGLIAGDQSLKKITGRVHHRF